MALSRRTFLHIPPLALAPLLPQCSGGDEPVNESSPFLHGVASGDPLPNAVVIWTRVSVEGGGTGPVTVDWWVLLDVTHERVQAEWYHVDTVAVRRADEVLAATLQVSSGDSHLIAALEASTPPSDAPPLAPMFAANTAA